MSLKRERAIVCGAGGFIGGHLVKSLIAHGVDVIRGVDIKPLAEWHQVTNGVENLVLDLQDRQNCLTTATGATSIYQLAADMGGIGFIENHKALCMLSVLINTHMLMAARDKGVERFFYSSSACVYNGDKQNRPDAAALKEADAYPAMPEDGYNVYGPFGTWDGGREKAPAAICRKVLDAKHSGKHEIEIWGDGSQTRSFMYIDDCLKGIRMLIESDIHEPLNLGSSELVTVNQLVDMVEDIAGIKLKRSYDLSAPKGVNGRNSDNTLIMAKLGWAPSIRLRVGMEKTYNWIESEMLAGPAR